MSWGHRVPASTRAGTRSGLARRGWIAVVTLAGVCGWLPAAASPASAAGGRYCDGFAACSVNGYTTHGYPANEWNSYWRMYPGDNCTNYVAYAESAAFGVPTPDYLLGNAGEWPGNAAAHGVPVNTTPSVGAVAVWYGGAPGIGSSGHVAVVEQVGPGGAWVVLSQEHLASDIDGFEWTTVSRGGTANDGWESFPDVFIHFNGSPPAPRPSSRPASAPAPVADLARVGDFGSGAGRTWTASPRSNFATFPAHVVGTDPYAGARFAATNTTAAGGGIFEDIPVATTPGESICAGAEVVSVGRRPGARGALTIWLLGGGAPESSSAGFGPLPAGDAWAPVTVCTTASSAHDHLRVQFYDAPRTPTLGIDAVDVHLSLARDATFGAAGADAWRRSGRSGFAVYGRGASATAPFETGRFAATSSSSVGGGIYQDIPVHAGPGASYCADAEVVTVGRRPGARGQLVLWLLGGREPEESSVSFGPLPGSSSWAPVTTCVTAAGSSSDLRVQFYVAPGTPALGVDAVDVHRSLVADGGFDSAALGRSWTLWARSNFLTVGGRRFATLPFEGAGYGVTNTAVPGGGIYQDIRYAVSPGESFCASAEVVTMGRHAGARGLMVVWLLGGGPPQDVAVPFGPLGGEDAWSRVAACVSSTGVHHDIRVQFYVAAGTPTLAIDAVDLR
jgi:hypothetical protein